MDGKHPCHHRPKSAVHLVYIYQRIQTVPRKPSKGQVKRRGSHIFSTRIVSSNHQDKHGLKSFKMFSNRKCLLQGFCKPKNKHTFQNFQERSGCLKAFKSAKKTKMNSSCNPQDKHPNTICPYSSSNPCFSYLKPLKTC